MSILLQKIRKLFVPTKRSYPFQELTREERLEYARRLEWNFSHLRARV